MNEIVYPVTPVELLTVSGLTMFAVFLLQWIKREAPTWRWANLAVLAGCIFFAELIQFGLKYWEPMFEEIIAALLIGFFAASAATFGQVAAPSVAHAVRLAQRAVGRVG